MWLYKNPMATMGLSIVIDLSSRSYQFYSTFELADLQSNVGPDEVSQIFVTFLTE